MLLLLVANILNIAADVAAMGEVAELVIGFNRQHMLTVIFAVGTLLLAGVCTLPPLCFLLEAFG